MAELIIRKGTIEDVPQIAILERLCFSDPWSIETLERDLSENKLCLYIVAELEGNVIGYVGVWNIGDEGYINNVAVSPMYRKQHIGTLLLDTLIESTEAVGIKKHTLEVRKSNEPAKALYKKFDFVETGIRPKYYENNGEDAIIMWRGLE